MVAPWAERQPITTPIAPRHPQNVRDDEALFIPSSLYGGDQNQWATTHTPYNQTSFQQLVNELIGVNNRFGHLNDMHPQNRTS